MTDENLVLEHLKAIRNEIRDHKRSTDAGFKDLRSRMTGIETRLVGLELHAVSQHGDAARHESRFEEMEDRIQKIERRLEITDKGQETQTMQDAKTHILARDNGPDVRFIGELIAEVDSHRPGVSRWTELALFRTTSGKWICREVGRTIHDGEHDRFLVHVCADDDELQAAIGHGWLAKQLYAAAGIAAFEDIE